MSRARVNALNRAKNVLATARAEGRNLTSSEQELIEAMASMAEFDGADEYFKQFGGGAESVNQVSANWAGGGPGDIFVNSQGYKSIVDPDNRPQNWSSGPVKVGSAPIEMKGTLLESNSGGPGGGLTPPGYIPGVVPKLFEELGVAQLFGQSQTSSSQVRYIVEGTAVGGLSTGGVSLGVAEGAAKPEVSVAYSEVQEPVRKLAAFLPCSEELIQKVGGALTKWHEYLQPKAKEGTGARGTPTQEARASSAETEGQGQA
jgi:HK97 family phage major capsid protein